ncbi:MAG TPA: hypothetical protein VFA31_05080 [Candidatus Polarisedimenticolia bacterium]|nr:hypothetical protein [Candidatus Polarisedimenticolia bacterium]
MGTRITDQPPEHWAGPDSLDPTPVWKQFALIGIFLALGLVLLGGVAIFAAAPQLVTPPALVPGDRLVLSAAELPAVGATPKRFGPPLVDDEHTFWLARLSNTETVAFRATWTDSFGHECPVSWNESLNNQPLRFFTASCKGSSTRLFNDRGEAGPGAPRGLDRYLVSVSDDRVIVNLSRLIVSPERTSAPPSP